MRNLLAQGTCALRFCSDPWDPRICKKVQGIVTSTMRFDLCQEMSRTYCNDRSVAKIRKRVSNAVSITYFINLKIIFHINKYYLFSTLYGKKLTKADHFTLYGNSLFKVSISSGEWCFFTWYGRKVGFRTFYYCNSNRRLLVLYHDKICIM